MRVLVLVLIGCSGATPSVDAGSSDAGSDAGLDVMRPECRPDAGRLTVVMKFVGSQYAARCTRPPCVAGGMPLEAPDTCRLKRIYADAGCGWREDGGHIEFDCEPLCGTSLASQPCCERLPAGAEPESCNWTAP